MMKSSAAAIALAVLAVAPAASANAPFLPHNTPHTFSGGECNVTVQHGNYLGAAYAKIMGNHGWCYSIHVQVVYLDGNGQLQGALWEAGRPPDAGVWYQSTQHYANIVGSNYYVCPWYGVCYFYQFSAI